MATIVRDSMTGTGYADLDDPSEHSTEVGGPWVRNAATPSTRWYLFNNRCHCAEYTGAIYASGSPPSANYYVDADYIILTDIQGPMICARMSTSALTFYGVRYQSGQYVLSKFVNGVEEWIGPQYVANHVGTTHKVRITVSGSSTTTIVVAIDGVDRITATDASSPITAAGKAGLASPFGTNDSGSGKHIANFLAADNSGSAVRATVFAFIE